MVDNIPLPKRQKQGNVIINKCINCKDSKVLKQDCPNCMSINNLTEEYQQIKSDTKKELLDLKEVERRLKKLETRLIAYLKDEDNNDHTSSTTDKKLKKPQLFSTTIHDEPFIEPHITFKENTINIKTSLVESHHFAKLLMSGINPTFVRENSNLIFSRQVRIISPMDQHAHHQLSHIVIDKETPEELAWIDMILTTRYSRCFILYQMVEKDKLIEWISQPYIDGLRGQNKLDHTLLSKAVRAYIYSHEKYSTHQHFNHNRPCQNDDFLSKHINTNRGEFYFQQAEEILELCYLSCSKNNIRSLLHMYMYQVTTTNDHLKAIHYSELAIRMAQNLNLNKEKGMLINEAMREDDRRLWWSCVWIHLTTSLTFGRPLLVDESDILLARNQPRKRQNETNEVGFCLDFCIHSVKLMVLRRSIYKCLQTKTTEIQLIHNLTYIEQQLEKWYVELPEELSPHHWSQHSMMNQQNDINSNSSNNDQHVEMDGVELQEVPSRAFCIELGLLLYGNFTTLKMYVYESFHTGDQRILDLIVMRNRFNSVIEYTDYLLRLIPQTHPCLIFFILTIIEPSLTTLYELTLYQHNSSIANRSIQQLLSLQNMLKQCPFTNDINAKQWILEIDNALQKVNSCQPQPQPQQSQPQSQSFQEQYVSPSSSSAPLFSIDSSSTSSIPNHTPFVSTSASLTSTSTSYMSIDHSSYYINNNNSNIAFNNYGQSSLPSTIYNHDIAMQDIQSFNNSNNSGSSSSFIRGDLSSNTKSSNISNSLVYPPNN